MAAEHKTAKHKTLVMALIISCSRLPRGDSFGQFKKLQIKNKSKKGNQKIQNGSINDILLCNFGAAKRVSFPAFFVPLQRCRHRLVRELQESCQRGVFCVRARELVISRALARPEDEFLRAFISKQLGHARGQLCRWVGAKLVLVLFFCCWPERGPADAVAVQRFRKGFQCLPLAHRVCDNDLCARVHAIGEQQRQRPREGCRQPWVVHAVGGDDEIASGRQLLVGGARLERVLLPVEARGAAKLLEGICLVRCAVVPPVSGAPGWNGKLAAMLCSMLSTTFAR